MKTRSLYLVALFFLLCTSISAQDTQTEKEKKNTLKANPLGLIIGIGKFNYERLIGANSSAQLGISYFSYTSDDSGLSGLGIVPEYRFYTTETPLEGFYVAPFMKYNALTIKDDFDGFKATVNAYRIGAKAGFQWLMGKNENFVIDLAFGGKYSDFNLKVKEGSADDFDSENLFEGFSPELNFAIGFAF